MFALVYRSGRTIAESFDVGALLDLAAARIIKGETADLRIVLTRSRDIRFDPPKVYYLIEDAVERIDGSGVPATVTVDRAEWAFAHLGLP